MMDTPALITFKATGTAGANVVSFTPSVSGYYAIGIISTPGTSGVTYSIKIE
jgi:hypothetical protein